MCGGGVTCAFGERIIGLVASQVLTADSMLRGNQQPSDPYHMGGMAEQYPKAAWVLVHHSLSLILVAGEG